MSSTTSGRPSASTSATAIEAPAFSQGNQSGTGLNGVCMGHRSGRGKVGESHRRTGTGGNSRTAASPNPTLRPRPARPVLQQHIELILPVGLVDQVVAGVVE